MKYENLKYEVLVSNTNHEELVALVNSYIKDGWLPQGGIVISVSREQGYTIKTFAQAMIKK